MAQAHQKMSLNLGMNSANRHSVVEIARENASQCTVSPDLEGKSSESGRHKILSDFHYSRAPVLVAIALVEAGLDSMSAVTFIRERRCVCV
jgi:superfamily II DNA or RNA helicase